MFAISPDVSSVSRELRKKIESDHRGAVGFTFLSDPTSSAIDRYGLRDRAYAHEKINGVPRPAVFVLDQRGRVRWEKVERDYRERPSNEEVAAALDAFE